MDASAPLPPLQPGQVLARGVCRFLLDAGFAPVTEFSPVRGLRTDITALGREGDIWVVECKSSVADFRSDGKWRGYLPYADRFFFAVGQDFPADILPVEAGLILADGFWADMVREAPLQKLPAARRKAQMLKIGRAAALRLRAALDPGAAAIIGASREGD